MSCAVFTLIGIYGAATRASSRWLFFASCTAALIMFLVALYLAWRDKAVQVRTLDNQIHAFKSELKNRHPRLQGQILQLNVFSIATESGDVTGALIVLEIKNSGADTIVERYSLGAIVDGQGCKGSLYAIPSTLSLPGSQGVNTFSSKDAIYEKTSTEPIKTGGRVTGVLLARFPGLAREQLNAQNVFVRFSDINGTEYEAKMGALDTSGERT